MNANIKYAATSLALAAMLLASCAKVETAGRVNAGDLPMEFGTYIPRAMDAPSTRYDTSSFVLGTVLPDSCSFGVFAYYQQGTVGSGTPATWNASRTPDFMFNQKVEYFEGDYNYAPLRYWPANEENTLSFWAYYPYSAYNTGNTGALKLYSNAACTAAYTSNSTGLPYAKYTVPMDPDAQVDLLFDSFANTDRTYWNCSSTPGTIPFTFRHALSWVEFQIIEGTGAVINSMTVSDLYWSGVCENPTTRSWTSLGDLAPYSISDITVSSSTICSMLLMPQDLTVQDPQLTINYDINFDSSDPGHPDPIQFKGNSGSVYLKDARNSDDSASAGITAWEPGHHYIYKIKAGFERIEFEEVIDAGDDWGTGNSNISVSE